MKGRMAIVTAAIIVCVAGLYQGPVRADYITNTYMQAVLDTETNTDSLIVIADSLKTLLSTVTDSYGMMTSTGRVTVVINESADDIVYGTPKYYAVPMAGYSRCTLKCLYGSTTTSIPLINVLLSETSDITLATGNPVWFDTTPADSTIGGWYMHGVPATTGNLGKTIQVTDIYGNWATADYLIVKVTASTNTAVDVQDFKLIAIKEQ